MGSANLALVFGPTLTRAPDSVDPRQLHNDVPSINVLIQLCIDHHEFLVGTEDDQETSADGAEKGVSPDMLSTSPPSEPPSAPSSAPPDKVRQAMHMCTCISMHVRSLHGLVGNGMVV